MPAESLALRSPAGAELWFTLTRESRDSAGGACVERALELRDDGRRTPVPLLYTGETPVLKNDTTARVHLWSGCRPGDAYDVDLRSGRPTRVRP